MGKCVDGASWPRAGQGASVPLGAVPGAAEPCGRVSHPVGETTKGKNRADPCPLVLPQLCRQAVEVWPFPTEAAAQKVGRLLPEALPPCRPAGTGVVAERRLQGRVLHPARHRPQWKALEETGMREMKFRPASCYLSPPLLTLPFARFFFFFFGQLIGESIFPSPKGPSTTFSISETRGADRLIVLIFKKTYLDQNN